MIRQSVLQQQAMQQKQLEIERKDGGEVCKVINSKGQDSVEEQLYGSLVHVVHRICGCDMW